MQKPLDHRHAVTIGQATYIRRLGKGYRAVLSHQVFHVEEHSICLLERLRQ